MITPKHEHNLEQQLQSWLKRFPADVPVVVVPIYNAYNEVMVCVESLLATLPGDVPLLLLDDASTDERLPQTLSALPLGPRGQYGRKAVNSGFVGTVNLAFNACRPHDVVLVNSDVVVPPRWLERLRAAAYSYPDAASATPLTNSGTILSVPYRNQPTPELVAGLTLAEIDTRIARASLKLRPLLPTAVGHCVYFRRAALDKVGYFDPVFAPGYGEEVDFSQRALQAGFCHVAADDLFVFHKGGSSFAGTEQLPQLKLQQTHALIIHARYPHYRQSIIQAANNPTSPLAQALERARQAVLEESPAAPQVQPGFVQSSLLRSSRMIRLWQRRGFWPLFYELKEYVGWQLLQFKPVRLWWLKHKNY
ncbi:MAG: glycosyltransferase family 2 protein [Anaerolineales bacterium]|nr:glycosyltransferase family 2 protein [Anaerolineales bacterium]